MDTNARRERRRDQAGDRKPRRQGARRLLSPTMRVLRVIDRNNPPSKPREIRGRAAIATFWDDICSRAMTHSVDTTHRRRRPPRLHAGLRLSRRRQGLLRCDARSQGRQDRQADGRAGLGRVIRRPAAACSHQPELLVEAERVVIVALRDDLAVLDAEHRRAGEGEVLAGRGGAVGPGAGVGA